MIRYVFKRILIMIPVIIGVTLLIFTIMYFTPGDPAKMLLGSDAEQWEIDELREELGLNDSYVVRLGKYMYNAFIRFDLGKSYVNKKDVAQEIINRFPNTLQLAASGLAFALIVGIPLGVIAAVNQYTWKDNTAMVVALFGISMPGFWVALMLSLLFALKLGWLPATGWGEPANVIMPCIAVGLNGVGTIARQMRSSMLEVIRQDYIVTARAKGVPEWSVIYEHALGNSLIPVVTQAGAMFGQLLGGSMVIETVFSIAGLGSYMVSAIKNRDYPAVQGSVLYVAIVFGLVMLLVDLMYAFIDPRIKAQYKRAKVLKVRKEANADA